MTRKHALITGATGFVGANLARKLLGAGHEIHLLLRRGFTPWRIESIRNDVRLHEADLSDLESLAGVVATIKPDWIFHLAAYGAYSTQADLWKMIHTNISGTVNLVQACLKIGFEAFINTGSSSEYGFKDHPPAETEWLDPNSYYATTKASATLFCRYVAQKENAPITTLRLYSVYGPYEEPTRLMPTLIIKGLKNELPPLVNPDIARDYIYVDDVCHAYLRAAEMAGKERGLVFNVGTGTQTTIREMVDLARKILKVTAEPEWGTMPDRIWDTASWVADTRFAQKRLGWRPRNDLPAGFQAMVAWIKECPGMLAWYTRRSASAHP